MSFVNDHLFFFVVMTRIVLMTSQPLTQIPPEDLELLELSLSNLLRAEQDYVNLTFGENPPFGYKSNRLEPPEGISLPVGNNTTDIRASVCAINDYLQNHINIILCNETRPCQELVSSIRTFSRQFSAVFEPTLKKASQCRQQITADHTYALEKMGLRIIYFTRLWVQQFIDTKPGNF